MNRVFGGCRSLALHIQTEMRLPRAGFASRGYLFELAPVAPIGQGGGATWPTLTVRDANTYKKVKRGAGSMAAGMSRILPLVQAISPDGPPPNNGQLNPRWCEWFLGFPLGWTEVTP